MMQQMRYNQYVILFYFTCFFQLISLYKVNAQNSNSPHSLTVRAVAGSHALGGSGGALQDKLYGLDLSYQKDISHITDSWVKRSNAKSAGMAFVFRDLQYLKGHQDTSANAFGQAFGMVGNLNFQLLKIGNTSVIISPAIGLSYLTKTFFTDKRNRFIGSHLNEIIKADLQFQVPLSSRLDLTAGAGFLHYSNGGFNIPNSGVNMLSLSGGMRFKEHSFEKEARQTRFNQLRKNTLELNIGIGRRGVYESHDGLLKSGFYAGYNYYINDILSLKGGFDGVYYYTRFNPNRGIQTFQYYGTSYDKWRTGVAMGAETIIWRLALNAQLGRYLHYNSYYKDIEWFWTTGLIYHVSPHVGIQAKTYFHGSQADFINYGLVFKL
jgi:hypothetical protein